MSILGWVAVWGVAGAWAGPGVCSHWGEPSVVGRFDREVLNEASGIMPSRQFPDRLYLHNDSGDGSYFYVTHGDGELIRKVEVTDSVAIDVEDIGLGPCGDRTCLFLGDIGDNLEIRSTIEVRVVEEVQNFPAKVKPAKQLVLRYPDGSHNAEGLAVHPNGDLYILTKEMNAVTHSPRPALLYRLPKKDWEGLTQAPGAPPLTLQKVGEIDIPELAKKSTRWGKIVTAFDIAPDGTKFMALTYEKAFEFAFDLARLTALPATSELVEARNYRALSLVELHQQEALAYSPDGRSILYTTEVEKKKHDAPLMRVDCAD